MGRMLKHPAIPTNRINGKEGKRLFVGAGFGQVAQPAPCAAGRMGNDGAATVESAGIPVTVEYITAGHALVNRVLPGEQDRHGRKGQVKAGELHQAACLAVSGTKPVTMV